MRRVIERLSTGAVLGAFSLAMAGAAGGHSILIESSPGSGTSVRQAPPAVVLRFSNRIEKALSKIRLVDGSGRAIPLPIVPDGPPDSLQAAAPALGPDLYRVEWHVFSTDGHVVSGRFLFRVVP